MNVYNPFRYKEWEIERAYNASLQARVSQLNGVASKMPSMSPAEQEQMTKQLLTQYQNEVNPFLRSMQVRAAAQSQSASAAKLFELATVDSEGQVRREACAALGARNDADSMRMLVQLVANDASDDVRLAAARALGEKKESATAIPALASALESPNPALQRGAVESLRKLSGKDYGGDLTAWRALAKGAPAPTAPNKELPAFANRWDWRFW